MDNEQIKILFDGLKENFTELKNDLKESIKEGKLEHSKINDDVKELTGQITKVENAIVNHLNNTVKSSKSKRDNAYLLIGIVGVLIALTTIIHKFT